MHSTNRPTTLVLNPLKWSTLTWLVFLAVVGTGRSPRISEQLNFATEVERELKALAGRPGPPPGGPVRERGCYGWRPDRRGLRLHHRGVLRSHDREVLRSHHRHGWRREVRGCIGPNRVAWAPFERATGRFSRREWGARLGSACRGPARAGVRGCGFDRQWSLDRPGPGGGGHGAARCGPRGFGQPGKRVGNFRRTVPACRGPARLPPQMSGVGRRRTSGPRRSPALPAWARLAVARPARPRRWGHGAARCGAWDFGQPGKRVGNFRRNVATCAGRLAFRHRCLALDGAGRQGHAAPRRRQRGHDSRSFDRPGPGGGGHGAARCGRVGLRPDREVGRELPPNVATCAGRLAFRHRSLALDDAGRQGHAAPRRRQRGHDSRSLDRPWPGYGGHGAARGGAWGFGQTGKRAGNFRRNVATCAGRLAVHRRCLAAEDGSGGRRADSARPPAQARPQASQAVLVRPR